MIKLTSAELRYFLSHTFHHQFSWFATFYLYIQNNYIIEKRYKWWKDVYVHNSDDRCWIKKGKKDGWRWGIGEKEGRREKYSKDCSGQKEAKKRKVRRPPEIFHPQQGGRLNWHLLDHRQLVRRIKVVVSSSSSRFLNLKFGIRSKGFFFDAFTNLVTLLQ